MIDEVALRKSNDRQTEKAFAITNALYDMGYPSAVGGGCARRFMGWCEWMNDADMISTAPHVVAEKVFKDHGLSIPAIHEHIVTGWDDDGLYEICCWGEQGDDCSVFSSHYTNWRFEHRALVLNARTKEPIDQPGGVHNTDGVTARIDPEKLFAWEPYMCYLGLAYACREDLPFDERLMKLMKEKAHVNFFMGLFFRIISKTLLGKAPSKGMDRLLEANAFYYLPRLQEAWRSASDSLRRSLDDCSEWFQPWILLMKENPDIKPDLLRIYFPEQWLTHYQREPCEIFPCFDDDRRKDSWPYWHSKKMTRDIVEPPQYILESPRITGRPTPWPFP